MGPSIILSERLEGAGRKGGRSPLCALYLKRKVLSILYMSPTAARLLRDIPTAKKCLAEPLRRLPPTTRKPPFPYLWRVLGVVRGRVAGRRALCRPPGDQCRPDDPFKPSPNATARAHTPWMGSLNFGVVSLSLLRGVWGAS